MITGMSEDAAETLTPHGRLLESARGATSKREAARLAGISEGRWRQVVTGRQSVGGGLNIVATPRRETLIAMAEAVAADVDEVLEAAGQPGQPRRKRSQRGKDAVRRREAAAAARSGSGRPPPVAGVDAHVGAGRDDAAGVMLDLPPEALQGLSPMEREELVAALRLRALEKAREIRRGRE